MRRRNIILDMDAYKSAHHLMQPPGYEYLESYGEARVGGEHKEVVFDGLHYVVQNYLNCPTHKEVDEAIQKSIKIFGYNTINEEIWRRVADLGYLPIELRGLPEGSKVPIGTPLWILKPTEDWFAPVCNGIETLLMRTWYPTTLMTRLHNIKSLLKTIYKNYGTEGMEEFAVNDFSARSGSCGEQADLAGMTFLKLFRGSDNMHGQLLLDDVYGVNHRCQSVWATEHSVALAFGPGEGEYEYIKHQLRTNTDQLKSIVADTYDYANFVSVVMTRPDVQELIDAHTGRIVIRPDSGDMFVNVLWTLEFLADRYGTIKKKGKLVIDKNIGVIQGDGMNEKTIIDLYNHIIFHGFSPDNMVTGSGTGIMFSDLTRDTDRFAMKPSVNIIKGEIINTIKDPKTDPSKRSKGGFLKVDSSFKTHSSMDFDLLEDFNQIKCVMVPYYVDGKVRTPDFDEILERLNS